MTEQLPPVDRRGIVATPPDGRWHLRRIDPIADLQPFVSWVWVVTWNVDQPVDVTILPFPSFNLAAEQGELLLHGPLRGVFKRRLDGHGQVTAVRLRPGAARHFVDRQANTFVAKVLAAGEVWSDLPQSVEDVGGDSQVAFLQQCLLAVAADQVDDRVALAIRAVEIVEADPSLCRVTDLADRLHLSKRSTQRLFADYVGLGIKETIRRYRLQEAADAAVTDANVDWAELATRLGYYDQSHLIAEFRSTFGVSPTNLTSRKQ